MPEWPRDLRQRLAKLIRMLASTNEAEVLSASRAIMRCLEAEGLDIHDLAELVLTSSSLLESVEAKSHQRNASPESNAYSEYIVRNSLLVSCSLCARNKNAMTDSELEFVNRLERRLKLEEPFTQDEIDRLNSISQRFEWRAP
jgi:hypothetical protein